MLDATILFTGVGGFLSSVVLTAWLRRYIIHHQMWDLPNTRSSHIVPTPRGGGVAFIVIFYITIAIVFYSSGGISAAAFNTVFWGGLTVATVGLCDDYLSLARFPRLAIHFSVALACLLYLGVPDIPLPGVTISPNWIVYPLAAVLLAGCLNFFNFMDGIDGIAGVQAITMLFGAIVIVVLMGTRPLDAGPSSYFWLLLAAVAGFLVWNWPTAKIFMGDTASGFLGFVLGLFAVITSLDKDMNVWSWLILFGVFLVDATGTLIVRVTRGELWYAAHRQHAYQRLAMNLQTMEGVFLSPKYARAYAHRTVILAVAGVNLFWLLPWAVLAAYYPVWGIVCAIIALLPLVVVVVNARNLGGPQGDAW